VLIELTVGVVGFLGMKGLPPTWKSFYERALDCLNDCDIVEARWSAERALVYLDKLMTEPSPRARLDVLMLLQHIATLQGDHELVRLCCSQVTLEQKSLWQYLREN
jgi:hypothetical protein